MKYFLKKEKMAAFALMAAVSAAVLIGGCGKAKKQKPEEIETDISQEVSMSNRQKFNMNTDWLYAPYNYENGELTDLDESGFSNVCVPHANEILSTYKGNDFQNQIDSYRFISWYRRHFTFDNSYAGKNIYVEFEGVATVADVYVNGEHVGTHEGAYTGFTFDITKYVKTDGSDNIMAVRVDSTKHGDIPPEGGDVDYCLFGGIVRNVNIHVTDKAHIDDVCITTPGVSEGDNSVNIDAVMVNTDKSDKECMLEAVIKDKDGNTVATASSEIVVKAGEETKYTLKTGSVENVNLWNTETPYLYTAEVRLKDGDAYLDVQNIKFGFRWFEFTNTNDESKFYLNGEMLVIRGINRHEQWPWIGRAANDKLQRADADMIKETGMNAVRCSHYPQSKAFLDRCDEIGLIVFEEAPGWQYVGGSKWQEVYMQNLSEMITRDKNHASIISWGVRANESFDNHSFYEKTNRLARELDPTRPTHGVRRMESYNDSEFQEDIFCVNYTYPAKPREMPFIITEHSMDWFNGNGIPGANDTKVAAFIKSFAEPLNYYYGNRFCAGGFGWSMFDYNNEVDYTKTGHLFYSGLYDIFRYEKPVAYLYRSQKSVDEEKVIYIANYWTENSTKDVIVFSNCDEVELFVNGKSQGKIKPNTYNNLPHPVYTFKNVSFESGELKAVGYINGAEIVTHVRQTPKEAAKLVMKAEYDTIVADGSDFTQVTVELTDANGTVLPYASDEISINITGDAEFIGEEVIKLEGGHTCFIVRSEYMKAGNVTCTAKMTSGDTVESASCEIKVTEYEDKNILPLPDSIPGGNVKPEEIILYDINDTVVSGNRNHFSYTGNWLYCYEAGCYDTDNHYSSTKDDYCDIVFEGTGVTFYGSKAPAHGIFTVSLDGGEEVRVDCYNTSRADKRVLYEVKNLESGKHTLRIRVTGEKNPSASGVYVNIDKAVIEP